MQKDELSIRKILDFLGADLDDFTVITLVDVFVSSVNEDIPNLEKAVANHDMSQIHKIGHKLKGSSSNLGFENFRQLCEAVEQHARNNLEFDYEATLKKIIEEKEHIENWFNSIKSDFGL